MPNKFRCGFVAIAGLPNAGKSTLVNALVGEKVAIVANKPQTTRGMVQGVVTTPEAQAIFVDTPGIHRSDSYFNRRMMTAVRQALDGPDIRVYVGDARREPSTEEIQALDTFRRAHRDLPKPSILALNKIDLVDDKRELLPVIARYQEQHPFDEIVPVSALKNSGLDDLMRTVIAALPVGEAIFPPDYLTDQPERYLAAEMIREQILARTRQEVPHAVAVKVEDWEEKPHLTRIAATISVERDGQKAILIGAKGQTLKAIGTAARQEIEAFLGRKVFLELFVQVRPDWRTDEAFVNELDWRSDA
jgi:GTP-binding protein Era